MNCSDSRRMSTFLHSYWRIAEPLDHGNQNFLFISSDTLPSSVLLAAQRSWTGLSSLRDLRNGVRIRLGDHASCAEAASAGGWSGALEESARVRSISLRRRRLARVIQRNRCRG